MFFLRGVLCRPDKVHLCVSQLCAQPGALLCMPDTRCTRRLMDSMEVVCIETSTMCPRTAIDTLCPTATAKPLPRTTGDACCFARTHSLQQNLNRGSKTMHGLSSFRNELPRTGSCGTVSRTSSTCALEPIVVPVGRSQTNTVLLSEASY